MATIPFLILHLMTIAVLIAIPILYVIGVLYLLKLLIGNMSVRINCICFALLLSLPIAWISSSYISFRMACDQSRGPTINRSIDSVRGIATKPYQSYGASFKTSGISRVPHELVKSGIYQCLEHDNGNNTRVVTKEEQQHIAKKGRDLSVPLCSEYLFDISSPVPVSTIWRPFHHISKIQISNRLTGEILASSEEHLFGGSILVSYRKYLGYLFDGLSSKFSACGYLEVGYAYNKPHNWRGGKDSWKRYERADKDLILKVLKPMRPNS